MTRADLIAAVRTASGKPMMSERECLAIVRGVLGVVRESHAPQIEAGAVRYGEFRDLFTVLVLPHTSRRIGMSAAFTAMIDALLGEVGE